MRIIQAKIAGFGCFQNKTFDFDDDVNVIMQQNGAGKSTLAAFIKTMFYGVGDRKGQNIENLPRIKYQPWKSGDFGGELSFVLDSGEKYKIQRSFGHSESKDSFRLIDQKTKLESEKYTKNIGFELFGLDAEAYEKSVYLAQSSVQTGLNDSIGAKLNNLILNTDEQNNCESAINALENLRGKSLRSGYCAKVAEAEEQIRQLRNKIYVAVEREREISQSIVKLKQEEDKLKELALQKEAADQDIRKAEEQRLNAQKRKRLEDANSALKEREKRLGDLQAYAGIDDKEIEKIEAQYLRYKTAQNEFNTDLSDSVQEAEIAVAADEKKPDTKLYLFLMLIPSLLLVAGIIVVFFHSIAGIIMSAVAALGILVLFFLKNKKDTEARLKKIEQAQAVPVVQPQKASSTTKQEGDILSGYLSVYFDDVDDHNLYEKVVLLKQGYNQYKQAFDELKQEKQRYDQILQECGAEQAIDQPIVADIQTLNAKALNLQHQYDTQKTQIADLKARINHYYQSYDSLVMLNDLLADAQADKIYYEKQRELIAQAAAFLTEAKKNLSDLYLPRIKQEFDTLWKRIQFDSPIEIEIDSKLKVNANENGNIFELGYQSKGRQELVNICLRLSLVRLLFASESPFIILDDPFVNLDEDKIQAACQSLKLLAKQKCQIIYFCCHQSRAKHLLG